MRDIWRRIYIAGVLLEGWSECCGRLFEKNWRGFPNRALGQKYGRSHSANVLGQWPIDCMHGAWLSFLEHGGARQVAGWEALEGSWIPRLWGTINDFWHNKRQSTTANTQHKFSLSSLDPLGKHVDKAFIPAFFIAAKGDDFIKPHHTEKLHKAYAGEKKLMIVEGWLATNLETMAAVDLPMFSTLLGFSSTICSKSRTSLLSNKSPTAIPTSKSLAKGIWDTWMCLLETTGNIWTTKRISAKLFNGLWSKSDWSILL